MLKFDDILNNDSKVCIFNKNVTKEQVLSLGMQFALMYYDGDDDTCKANILTVVEDNGNLSLIDNNENKHAQLVIGDDNRSLYVINALIEGEWLYGVKCNNDPSINLNGLDSFVFGGLSWIVDQGDLTKVNGPTLKRKNQSTWELQRGDGELWINYGFGLDPYFDYYDYLYISAAGSADPEEAYTIHLSPEGVKNILEVLMSMFTSDSVVLGEPSQQYVCPVNAVDFNQQSISTIPLQIIRETKRFTQTSREHAGDVIVQFSRGLLSEELIRNLRVVAQVDDTVGIYEAVGTLPLENTSLTMANINDQSHTPAFIIKIAGNKLETQNVSETVPYTLVIWDSDFNGQSLRELESDATQQAPIQTTIIPELYQNETDEYLAGVVTPNANESGFILKIRKTAQNEYEFYSDREQIELMRSTYANIDEVLQMMLNIEFSNVTLETQLQSPLSGSDYVSFVLWTDEELIAL